MSLDALVADIGRSAAVSVEEARRSVAVSQARLAAACVDYADSRAAMERDDRHGPGRPKPGEFAADELAPLLRQQSWHARCLVARTRRIHSGLPAVWSAFEAGEVDAEQVVMIDRIARRATETATLHAVDDQAADAAQTRTAKQLAAWLLRLIAQLEPDGIGYVTGEVSAPDAAEIDSLLTAAARGLGAVDPRSQQQRRADLFADLLLGRLDFTDDNIKPDPDPATDAWIEVEEIDPETGELLGIHRQRLDNDGLPVDHPSDDREPASGRIFRRRSQTLRIGIVVPLSSLLGLTDTPGQLTDRSSCVPGEVLRQQIADLLEIGDSETPQDSVLFTRLLTDDGGRLLDTTELGRFPSRRLAEATHYRVVDDPLPTGRL